jgi:hypothetical protein
MTRSVLKCVAAVLFVALLTLAAADRTSHGQMMTLGVGAGGAGGSSCPNHDPDFSSVVLLVGNDSAANGSTTFTDQSNSAHNLTIGSGNPAYSNTTAPTGLSSSIEIPGSGAFIESANSADWQFGSGNWTIELFFNARASSEQTLVTTMSLSGVVDEFLVALNVSGETTFGFSHVTTGGTWDLISGGVTGGGAYTANVWTHVAWSRVGSNFYSAVGGTSTLIGTSPNAAAATTNPLAIGATSSDNTSWPLNGYAAAIRITKGVARYGSNNFTPPSLPLPNC